MRAWLIRATANRCKSWGRSFWRKRTVPLELNQAAVPPPPEHGALPAEPGQRKAEGCAEGGMDMNSHERYRNTLRGLTPSHAWRKDTLKAMKAAQGRKKRPHCGPLTVSAAAAALALVVTGGIWWSSRMETDRDDPGVARTPEPVVTPSQTSSIPQDDARRNDAFSIVTDANQLFGNNPTAGQLEELTRLPVYENPIPTEEEQRALLDQWAEVLGLTVAKTDWYPAQGEDTMGREPTLEAECTDGTWLSLHGLNFLSVYNSPDQTRLEEAALAYLGKSGLEPTQENRETFAYTSEKEAIQVTWLKDPDASLAEQLYSYSFQRIENTYGSRLTICLPPITAGVDTSAFTGVGVAYVPAIESEYQ